MLKKGENEEEMEGIHGERARRKEAILAGEVP